MKKTLLLNIIFIMLLSLFSCGTKNKDTVSASEKQRYVYLVAGFDEAAENTDVLFTVSYDFKTNHVYVAQIPRDTYFGFGKAQNKINQIYATRRLYGDDQNTAMKYLSDTLAEAFGTVFDGYAGVTVETFKKTVDALGGIDIELPSDMTITSTDGKVVVLKNGINHINGDVAEYFIRYRKGYVTGDLGRIDAQKFFLDALFKKIASGISLPAIISIARTLNDDIITDVKLTDGISLISEILRSEGDKTTYYVTMPGEAIQSDNGISFYVLNRKNAAEVTRKYMNSEKEFDLKRVFYNSGEIGFVNIYDDSMSEYREYSNSTLNEISIK